MTRRSASRGILYSAPPTAESETEDGEPESTEQSEPTAEAEESAGETAAADD